MLQTHNLGWEFELGRRESGEARRVSEGGEGAHQVGSARQSRATEAARQGHQKLGHLRPPVLQGEIKFYGDWSRVLWRGATKASNPSPPCLWSVRRYQQLLEILAMIFGQLRMQAHERIDKPMESPTARAYCTCVRERYPNLLDKRVTPFLRHDCMRRCVSTFTKLYRCNAQRM